MTARHTDQDVAALYCAMRDTLLAEPGSMWMRILDVLAPKVAARRRVVVMERLYREWQEARPAVIVEEAPLPMQATVMAQMMVRQTMKDLRDRA